MNAAPAIDAAEPASVIPPEVPAGTRFPDTIDRASPPTRVPTSVAHVSAADAASAPMPIASQIADGDTRLATAATVNSPPFAATCHKSRSSVFATIALEISSFRCAPAFESAVPETKNAARRAAQLHPAVTAMVPETTAAAAPSRDREFVRSA